MHDTTGISPASSDPIDRTALALPLALTFRFPASRRRADTGRISDQ